MRDKELNGEIRYIKYVLSDKINGFCLNIILHINEKFLK